MDARTRATPALQTNATVTRNTDGALAITVEVDPTMFEGGHFGPIIHLFRPDGTLKHVSDIQDEVVLNAFSAASGCKIKAATMLGVNRATFAKWHRRATRKRNV